MFSKILDKKVNKKMIFGFLAPLVGAFIGADYLGYKLGYTKKRLLDFSPLFGESNLDFSSMGNKYNDGKVSEWLLKQVQKSEGLERKAYTANSDERARGIWTIGYGTVFLFNADGTPFNNGYAYGKYGKGEGVKPTDTLSSLKNKMGYGNLTDEDFALQLIINHTYSKTGSYSKISTYFDKNGIPFNQKVKDALQEWSYGSGEAYTYLSKGKFEDFISAIRSGNVLKMAYEYALLRFSYYSSIKAWFSPANGLSNRFSWLKRVYVSSCHIKGISSSMNEIDMITNKGGKIQRLVNLSNKFYSDLGLNKKFV